MGYGFITFDMCLSSSGSLLRLKQIHPTGALYLWTSNFCNNSRTEECLSVTQFDSGHISLNWIFLVCRTQRTPLYLRNSAVFLMSQGGKYGYMLLLGCSMLTCHLFSRNENQVWPRRGSHGSREPASSELPQRLPRLPGFQSIRLRTLQL